MRAGAAETEEAASTCSWLLARTNRFLVRGLVFERIRLPCRQATEPAAVATGWSVADAAGSAPFTTTWLNPLRVVSVAGGLQVAHYTVEDHPTPKGPR